MPHSSQSQIERQQAIRDLLATGPAATQQSLVDALIEQGFDATQSSVSRDLKDIGAIKTAAGYQLAESAQDDGAFSQIATLIRALKPAGPNLLVIQTAIGGAQRVALALDRSGWPELVGNIGGDDTVFAATPNAAAQRALVSRIEQATAPG